MAENENGQEKTEEATSRKLDKSRDEGQVPRSKELNTAFILIGGVSGLMMLGGDLAEALLALMKHSFSLSRATIFDDRMMLISLVDSIYHGFGAAFPFFLLLTIAALVGPMSLGGWLISAKALAPKISRMNPAKGLGRMFSMTALVELLKAMGKFLIVAGIAVVILVGLKTELLNIGSSSVAESVAHAMELVCWSLLAISCGMIIISAIDVPWQIFDHSKKMRMTLQEVKDEMKDSDGKPEVKGRIRQLQHEMAQRRMMEAVPEADVVITNPEHFSVALKYDTEGGGAPVVVAKGVDHMAMKIREIARAHEIHLLPAPLLARAIYFTTDLDREIPGPLYQAVAQVLAYVFKLKNHRAGKGLKPEQLGEVEVPRDLHYAANGHLFGSAPKSG